MRTPPHGSTVSTLDHLLRVEKASGKTPSQLLEYRKTKCPPSLEYVLAYFYDFYNGYEFSYTELQSWQSFTGVELDYCEAELVRQLCLEKEAFNFKRNQAAIDADKGKPRKR